MLQGLRNDAPLFNGLHLRLEQDAVEWAIILGGRAKLWKLYKRSMAAAEFDAVTPVYVASGLLKASTRNVTAPRQYMRKLSRDMVQSRVRTARSHMRSNRQHRFVDQMQQRRAPFVPDLMQRYHAAAVPRVSLAQIRIVVQTARVLTLYAVVQYASTIKHKELYLSLEELRGIGNEQSALIDLLVLRKSANLVGINVSTFSFYLAELRLIDGLPPRASQMLAASFIGTDELFYSCAIAAVRTRDALALQGRLPDECRTPAGLRCFADPNKTLEPFGSGGAGRDGTLRIRDRSYVGAAALKSARAQRSVFKSDVIPAIVSTLGAETVQSR